MGRFLPIPLALPPAGRCRPRSTPRIHVREDPAAGLCHRYRGGSRNFSHHHPRGMRRASLPVRLDGRRHRLPLPLDPRFLLIVVVGNVLSLLLTATKILKHLQRLKMSYLSEAEALKMVECGPTDNSRDALL